MNRETRLLSVTVLLTAACSATPDSPPPNTVDFFPPRTGSRGEVAEENREHATCSSGWTFLVYMVADNNLEPFGVGDIEEMMGVGSTDSLKIVVQADRAAGFSEDGVGGIANWESTKRLLVERGALTELADLGELNMGDPRSLADFIEWGVKTYPNDCTALVFWDHGGAWPGFGGDDSTPDHDLLTLAEVEAGLEAGMTAADLRTFNLIGFDACLMATYETAVSIRRFGEYMLASEELEPGHGWDYRSLAVLRDAPSTTARELGRELIKGFVAQAAASETGANITLSLTDLHGIATLSNAIVELADALNGKVSTIAPGIGGSVGESLEFGRAPDPAQSNHMVDLGHLAFRLGELDAAFGPARDAVMSALSYVIVENSTGPVTKVATGMSIYFPATAKYYRADYDQLNGVGAWRDFLKGFYSAGAAVGQRGLFATEAEAFWSAETETLDIIAGIEPALVSEIAFARLEYGIVDEQGEIVLGDSTAFIDPDGTVYASWDTGVLSMSQGDLTGYGYLSVELDGDDLSAVVPFAYVAPGAAEADYAILRYTYNAVTNVEQETFFVITDAGPGELAPLPGSTLFPLLYGRSEAGGEWFQSGEAPFDPMLFMDFSSQLLAEGTEVFVSLIISDYAGNFDVRTARGQL